MLTLFLTAANIWSMFVGQAPVATEPPARETWKVVVLPITNRSGIGGDTLAHRAEEELLHRLQDVSPFVGQTVEFIPPSRVIPAIRAAGSQEVLDLRWPNGLQAVAARLGARYWLQGDVVYTRTRTRKSNKTIELGFRLVARDVATGLLMSGTAVAASSDGRLDELDTSLLEYALDLAVLRACRQMMAEPVIEGTPFALEYPLIGLNRGARDGLAIGRILYVFQKSEMKARVVVTRVFPSHSELRVLTGARAVHGGMRAVSSSDWGEPDEGVPPRAPGRPERRLTQRPFSDWIVDAQGGL